MEIITKGINDITPYEKNPRQNDNAVKYVAESIKEFGFKQPIVIDKNGVIVAGHTRHRAAIELGLTEVPCIMADDLTEEQVKAYRLADNKVAEAAEWDIELLNEEIDEIFDIDMELFGFDFNLDEPEKKERKDLSDEVGETYEVIIACESELQQEELYYRLTEEGYVCRTLIL